MNIDTYISKNELLTDYETVKEKIIKYGKVIVFENDKPAFILLSCEYEDEFLENNYKQDSGRKINCWDAMEIVLKTAPNNTMHAKQLADEIYKRGLYTMKDGSPVTVMQLRARVTHRPNKFLALKGNYIKLL